MADEKVETGRAAPGGGTGAGGPGIENDPDVLAEVKKNRIWHLKLDRYKEVVRTVGFGLQTFKVEAVSLMSGIGTLVVGWIQIKRWVSRARPLGVPEAGRESRREERAGASSETRTSSGYGSGRSEGAHTSAMGGGRGLLPIVEELTAVASPAPDMARDRFFDPMGYMTIGLPVLFIGSSVAAWIKRKRKQPESDGGS